METKKVLIIGGVIFAVSASVFAGWMIMNPKSSNVSNQGEKPPSATRDGERQSNSLLADDGHQGTTLSVDGQQSGQGRSNTPPYSAGDEEQSNTLAASSADDILHAIQDNNLAAIQGFIDAGVNFNQTIGNSSTPLIYAIQRNCIEIARAILAAPGTDINYPVKGGSIAIHYAVSNGSDEMIRILLADERCARNQVNLNGLTSLQVAAIGGNTSAVKTLLEDPTVDRNIVSGCNRTALDFAIGYGNVDAVEMLLKDPHVVKDRVEETGMTIIHKIANVKITHEPGRANKLRILDAILHLRVININHQDRKGKTALHYAAEIGIPEIILKLIAAGADSAIKDQSDHNAVYYARKREPALESKYLDALNVHSVADDGEEQSNTLHSAAGKDHNPPPTTFDGQQSGQGRSNTLLADDGHQSITNQNNKRKNKRKTKK